MCIRERLFDEDENIFFPLQPNYRKRSYEQRKKNETLISIATETLNIEKFCVASL